MDKTTASPRNMDYEQVKRRFQSWDKEKLIDYALSATKALSAQQAASADQDDSRSLTPTLLQDLALIQEIGQHLSSTLDLDEVLKRLLILVNEALDVTEGSILLTEEPSGDLIFHTSLGSISEEIKPFRVPRGQGIAGEVALTGKPIRVENAQEDSRHFKKIDHDTGFLTRSILAVPLTTHGRTVGVIEIFNKRSGPFTETDEALLSSIANFAAIGIENARLHQNVIGERDRVIQAQEDASRKLQRDLHDGPTQLVANLQMGLEICRMALATDISRLGPQLDEMDKVARKATHQMRTMLFELRPLILETSGLQPALERFIERRSQNVRTKLHLVLNSDQPDERISRFDAKYERVLFDIVQETVNNALKYAEAKNIYAKIDQRGDQFKLTILDDGLGFDLRKVNHNYEERGSYGMLNLKERAELIGSKMVIRSAPGAGTEITLDFRITPDTLQQPV